MGGQTQGKVNTIKKDAQSGSAFAGKNGATDPYLLNIQADHKEAKIITMTTKLPNEYPKEHLEHIPGVTTMKPKQQNDNLKTLATLNAGYGQETIN